MTAPKKNPLGPTGWTVAANVKRLRNKHGMQFTELAAKLEQMGRPIPTLGLRKIEGGDRRVDADDLVALSIALGVNPNALLLPPTDDAQHVVTITGTGIQPAHAVWKWARGEGPLTYSDVPDDVPRQNRVAYAQAFFESHAKPAMQDWTKDPNVHLIESSDNGDDQ